MPLELQKVHWVIIICAYLIVLNLKANIWRWGCIVCKMSVRAGGLEQG